MRVMVTDWAALVLLAATVLCTGCSGSTVEPSAVVVGKVTLGGAPLTAGTVLFMTDDGNAASADLAPDGTYTLHCRPARFKVAVTPPPPVDPLSIPAGTSARAPSSQSPIPKRYHDLGSSGLTFEVKAGDNTFDIPLKR